jgi:hypothetical protein
MTIVIGKIYIRKQAAEGVVPAPELGNYLRPNHPHIEASRNETSFGSRVICTGFSDD